MGATTLSKSKYVAGLQCTRRLWLACHAPELASQPPPAMQAQFDMGAEIGRRARERFANGTLVSEEAWEHGRAVERTRQLMADDSVGAIFEAAFEHAGIRVRVDVLERGSGGGWNLCEVKSGTGVKPVYLHDVAVQRFVVAGAGVPIHSVEIMHIDSAYVRGERGIDWARFFARANVTAETAPLAESIPAQAVALQVMLSQAAAPAIEPSRHCFAPYACEFWGHCTAAKPPDWIFSLPRISAKQLASLGALAIERIIDIPDDFPLRSVQARARSAWRTGALHVEPALGANLSLMGPPTDYLDFETAFPAIPLYPGTRPYEQVPFQWSLHRLAASGRMVHREFLADGRGDPRPEFAQSLIDALREPNGPILVWSSFEDQIVAALAQTLPSHADDLRAVQGRLADLLPVARDHVYHPGFGGRFSIKAVAPTLAPGLRYDDLDGVADGGGAADVLMRLATGAIDSPDEVLRHRRALLVYCKRDTLAMVEVHRALRMCVTGQAGGSR
ncbi:MAG: DUF2779 domain-containing protein [bacterium]